MKNGNRVLRRFTAYLLVVMCVFVNCNLNISSVVLSNAEGMTAVSGNVSGSASGNASQDAQASASGNASQDASGSASGNASQDASGNASGNASQDAQASASGNASQDASGNPSGEAPAIVITRLEVVTSPAKLVHGKSLNMSKVRIDGYYSEKVEQVTVSSSDGQALSQMASSDSQALSQMASSDSQALSQMASSNASSDGNSVSSDASSDGNSASSNASSGTSNALSGNKITTSYTYVEKSMTIDNSKLTFTLADGSSVDGLKDCWGATKVTATLINASGDSVSTSFNITVIPDSATDIAQTKGTTTNIKLSWEKALYADGYQLRYYNKADSTWYFKYMTNKDGINISEMVFKSNSGKKLTIKVAKNQSYAFYLRSYHVMSDGTKLYGYNSSEIYTYSATGKISEVSLKTYSSTSVTITWKENKYATGYEIYRRNDNGNYIFIGSTKNTIYKDTGLTSGKTYAYKVTTYVSLMCVESDFSPYVKTSTGPAKSALSIKSGDTKARITWTKATGSTGYILYRMGPNDDEYSECQRFDNKTFIYTDSELKNNKQYKYKIMAYRTLDAGTQKEYTYNGDYSVVTTANTKKAAKTSTTPKNFLTLKSLKSGKAYTTNKWFKKFVNLKKSYVIPGCINTNVGGFTSYNMCPQGLAIAGKYMLMSAYDRSGEENSVIYVMSKKTRKLLTTIVLPDKTHAGGLEYDGHNIWVTHGKYIYSISFKEVKAAAAKKLEYDCVSYEAKCNTGNTASFIKYYKGKLWIGNYSETSNGKCVAFSISNKDTTPTIKATSSFTIPSRVQGLAFTNKGGIILSRSAYSLSYAKNYIAQLEYYEPKWSNGKVKKLKKVKNVIPTPCMSEEVVVYGNYFYVGYESVADPCVEQRMDRICAFKLSGLKVKPASLDEKK